MNYVFVIRLLKVLVIAFAYKEYNCSKSDQMFFCAVIHLYCEQCQYSSLQLLYKIMKCYTMNTDAAQDTHISKSQI